MSEQLTEQLTDTAERVLALCDRAAEAEVTVRSGGQSLTRFANSFIHQNVSETVSTVSVRLTFDGRTATASSDVSGDTEETLRGLVERTSAAARVRPRDPEWPGLTPPTEGTASGRYDEATAQAAPGERAERVRAFVSAADGLETAGYCDTNAVVAVYANSAGQHVGGRSTSATLDGIARTERSDGSARRSAGSIADLDGTMLGHEAAARARGSADATDIEPGRYEVVLAPSCVADMLFFLAYQGFNGRAVNEQRSFLRLGESQFDESVQLWDDATDPRTVGLTFDADGTPKRRVAFVDSGVTVGVAHDRRTAVVAGAESTGHAIEGGESMGALPVNLFLGPGQRTFEELVGGLERGLLVTDFWYTRILDPRTQVVTGLTRNGVFLVEDGRVTRPVANLRFTQSYVDALGPGSVRGIGRDLTLVDQMGAFFAVPALHLASWNFTGGAQG